MAKFSYISRPINSIERWDWWKWKIHRIFCMLKVITCARLFWYQIHSIFFVNAWSSHFISYIQLNFWLSCRRKIESPLQLGERKSYYSHSIELLIKFALERFKFEEENGWRGITCLYLSSVQHKLCLIPTSWNWFFKTLWSQPHWNGFTCSKYVYLSQYIRMSLYIQYIFLQCI